RRVDLGLEGDRAGPADGEAAARRGCGARADAHGERAVRGVVRRLVVAGLVRLGARVRARRDLDGPGDEGDARGDLVREDSVLRGVVARVVDVDRVLEHLAGQQAAAVDVLHRLRR